MKLRHIFITLASLLSFSLFAQDQSYTTIEYQLAFPGSSMNDFVSKPGYSGFNLEFTGMVTPRLGLGGTFGWNNFYEEFDRQAYPVAEHPGINYYAKKWRQIDAMPLLFKTSFILDNSQVVVPFASLGIGAYFMREREVVGPLTSDWSSTHFGLRPELGAMFMFGSAGIRLSGAFNGVFDNSSQDAEDMSHWNIALGVTFAPGRI